ncbi:hypothetical protein PO909_013620 [Leuciscus waleckii]
MAWLIYTSLELAIAVACCLGNVLVVWAVCLTRTSSAYLLFCGLSGRSRFPGRVGGSATGCVGGRVGGDPIPGLSGGQLCGVGADPSICVVSFGYCCGPIPAGINTSQV